MHVGKLSPKLRKTLSNCDISHKHIYQNYMKISENTIDEVHSKKSPLASILASRRLQNLPRSFPMISLFKLVNVAVIIAFSSSLVLHRVVLNLSLNRMIIKW